MGKFSLLYGKSEKNDFALCEIFCMACGNNFVILEGNGFLKLIKNQSIKELRRKLC